MQRVLEPEWLDDLSPDDPRAIASRRDLRRLNRIMGHPRLWRKTLTELFPNNGPNRLIEIGSGDGSLLLEVVRSNGWNTEAILLDRHPAILPETKTALAQCTRRVEIIPADVFQWLPNAEPADCIIANLFLHHFPTLELKKLLQQISAVTNTFIAAEPRRYRPALLSTYAIGLIGCNDVTRHDAPISICAGFRDHELSDLWPATGWQFREYTTFFSHWFIAQKK